MTWTPVQRLSIGAGTVLLVLALFGTAAAIAASRLSTQAQQITDVNGAIASLDQLLVASADAEHAGTEFMMTGAQDASEAFDKARGNVEDAVDVLRNRTEDRPRQRAELDSIGPLLGTRFAALSHGILIRKRQGADSAMKFARADAGRVTRGGMLPLVHRMRDEELRVLADRMRQQQLRGHTASTLMLGASLLAFVLAGLAFTPVRPAAAARLTRRLTTPMGMPVIPEYGESLAESTRVAGDRLSRLQQLAYALDNPGSAEAVGDAIIARGLGSVTSSSTVVCRHDGSAWHVVARRNAKPPVGSALPAELAKVFEDAARTREPVVMESQAERDKLYPRLPNLGVTQEVAMIAIPFVANGRSFGGFALAFEGPHVLGDDDRAYLATLGRLGGQALARIV